MSVNSSKIRWCQTYIHVISTTNAVLFHFKLTICLPSIVSRTSLAVYKERTIRTINPKIKKNFRTKLKWKFMGFCVTWYHFCEKKSIKKVSGITNYFWMFLGFSHDCVHSVWPKISNLKIRMFPILLWAFKYRDNVSNRH